MDTGGAGDPPRICQGIRSNLDATAEGRSKRGSRRDARSAIDATNLRAHHDRVGFCRLRFRCCGAGRRHRRGTGIPVAARVAWHSTAQPARTVTPNGPSEVDVGRYREPVEGMPFGRYQLIELLGRGGMGEVWRAHDTEIDRVVALKMLLPHYATELEFDTRFRCETLAAARLDDPHIVPIYDVGEIDGRLYVTMRLITGTDLQTLLNTGPLEPR